MLTAALFEKFLAGVVVFGCVALLLRQFIGAPRRYRLDSMLRRSYRSLRALASRASHWPAARRAARREADAAIRRARGAEADADADWQGNVARPKAFRKPRKFH